jgi:hypothetical protein
LLDALKGSFDVRLGQPKRFAFVSASPKDPADDWGEPCSVPPCASGRSEISGFLSPSREIQKSLLESLQEF